MQITDEMMALAVKAYIEVDGKCRPAAMRAALAAALSVETRVRVKPLEWREDSCGNWHGNSPIGDEFIQRWHSPGNERIEFEFDGVCHPTPEAAKAAAQADYSARILSALSVEPDPAPSSHLNGWQSMETAPKDGSYIDIYARPFTGQARRFIDCWWTERTGWRNGKADGLVGWTPTHWRYSDTPDAPALATEGKDNG